MSSRIKIRPGRGGFRGKPATPTLVELPFSELTPSMGGSTSIMLEQCTRVLDQLGPHERDVILANLLARYGRTS